MKFVTSLLKSITVPKPTPSHPIHLPHAPEENQPRNAEVERSSPIPSSDHILVPVSHPTHCPKTMRADRSETLALSAGHPH